MAVKTPIQPTYSNGTGFARRAAFAKPVAPCWVTCDEATNELYVLVNGPAATDATTAQGGYDLIVASRGGDNGNVVDVSFGGRFHVTQVNVTAAAAPNWNASGVPVGDAS
jgi:hypothetical protein